VAFNPDATRVVSGGKDHSVRVWAVASGTELATMKGHTGVVYSVTYSPDGNRIVSGSNDGTIRLWDAEIFDEVAVLRGHTSYVHSVCLNPDGTMLASGSGDETVRIWDTVSAAERWAQIQGARKLRRAAEPLVRRLLEEFADPLDVADHIRADDFRRAGSTSF
jgi:WD40 repeat protein